MRIENAINEVHGPQHAERKSAEVKRRKSASGRSSDVVEISDTARTLGAHGVVQVDQKSAQGVRQAKVEAVKERVKSGYYDRPEIRQAIADAVLNSGLMETVAQEIQLAREAKVEFQEVPDVREDRVALAKKRVEMGFYDSGGVKTQIAENLLDALIG
ncbi:MAG: flagellar biosynthesis anti-sigma factor FlgM [bacterium]|nr:flagellar biosynthesis anti-sigma factor FlgM [bacterium]